jgi:hypothetical protein
MKEYDDVKEIIIAKKREKFIRHTGEIQSQRTRSDGNEQENTTDINKMQVFMKTVYDIVDAD